MSTPGKSLHVALIPRHFYPEVTGVVTQHCRYGPLMARAGVRMTVDTLLTPTSAAAPTEVNQIHIRRHRVDESIANISPFLLDIALLGKATERWEKEGVYPDVVVLFINDRRMIPSLLRLRRKGVACVLSCTNFPGDYGEGWWPRLKCYLNAALSFQFFHKIFVPSGHLGKAYQQYGAPENRLVTIPFGIDCDQFAPFETPEQKRSLRRQLGLPEEALIVLFMGAVVERKGVDLLLAAWERVLREAPDAVLVYAGPYGERGTFTTLEENERHRAFIETFEQTRRSLSRPASVIMAGTVECPEMYFKSADVFAFPSRSEGLGAVVMEAMASALPCVLTPYEGFPEKEFGSENKEHLKVGFDPEAIAATIVSLLRDPERRATLGENARAFVLRELELTAVVNQMIRVLFDLKREVS